MPKSLQTIAISVALGMLVISCGSSGPSMSSTDVVEQTEPRAEELLIEAMIGRASNVSHDESLDLGQLFPTSSVSSDLGAFHGEVVAVEAGQAFDDNLEKSLIPSLVPFDDPRADWRTFHVHLRVIEVFAGELAENDEVTLGLAFGSATEETVVEQGLISMGEIVVFTGRAGFPYDASPMYSALQSGAFLSPVDGDLVPFPAIAAVDGHQDGAHSLLSKIDTLTELRELAARAASG